VNRGFDCTVVDAVTRHMNDDHADDALLIVRAHGGRPDAESARMTGMDTHGADFSVRAGDEQVVVRVPWARELTERAEVRPEIVRLYTEACHRLGLVPRQAGEH
jgi:putative heme iron utilization protein